MDKRTKLAQALAKTLGMPGRAEEMILGANYYTEDSKLRVQFRPFRPGDYEIAYKICAKLNGMIYDKQLRNSLVARKLTAGMRKGRFLHISWTDSNVEV